MLKKILIICLSAVLLLNLFSGCIEKPIEIEGNLKTTAYPPIGEEVPTCLVWAVETFEGSIFYLTQNKTPLCSLDDFGSFLENDAVFVTGTLHLLTKYNEKTKVYKAIEIDNISRVNNDKFDVHEWGVFVKGYDCNLTDILTESPPTIYGRKPVIYFHSLINNTNVCVKINSIKNASVIPDATLENNQIIWETTVENDLITLPNGTNYSYLFYEGETNFTTNIVAEITNIQSKDLKVTFHVKNLESYSISNIYLIFGYPMGIDNYQIHIGGMTYIYIEKLAPNEEKTITVPLKEGLSYETENLFLSLIENGLTSKEAEELIDYWEEWWFYPTNLGVYSRILYMVPQTIYDQLFPIEINPAPESIKRVGIITITDLPIVDSL